MKKRIAVLLALSLTAALPCTVMAEDTAEEAAEAQETDADAQDEAAEEKSEGVMT